MIESLMCEWDDGHPPLGPVLGSQVIDPIEVEDYRLKVDEWKDGRWDGGSVRKYTAVTL